MSTRHFLVVADTDDGDSLDLMVEALNPGQAIGLWRGYYELEDVKPARVFVVPELTGTPRAVPWHVSAGLSQVGGDL